MIRYILLLIALTLPVSADDVRLLLVGPPGAGKGTQAATLAKKLGAAHLSTGDMLRRQVKEGTELGKKAEGYMKSGGLVPDELILDIVKVELAKNPSFILDGFPRTVDQAKKLDDMLKALSRPLNLVILLTVDDEQLVERLGLRRTCPKCNKVYHLKTNPPKVEGKCDADGTALIQRPDDNAETIRKRLKVYHEQTAPVIEFYKPRGIVHTLDGSGSIESVEAQILKLIKVPAHS